MGWRRAIHRVVRAQWKLIGVSAVIAGGVFAGQDGPLQVRARGMLWAALCMRDRHNLIVRLRGCACIL